MLRRASYTGGAKPPASREPSGPLAPPRKRSALSRGGLMLGSQDTVSYLAPAAATGKDTITSTMRPGRGLREPSVDRGRQVGRPR